MDRPDGTGFDRSDPSVAVVDVQKATEQYFARIHRAALVLTGNPWDADDLAQETFLELSRLSDRYQGRSALYTWIYGILLNLERRHRRRRNIWQRKLQVLWDNEVSTERSAPLGLTVGQPSRRILARSGGRWLAVSH